jgi:DNA-binding CsgD family transcriptional regulator
MPNLTDIISMRRQPGVMILDRGGTLLYMNDVVSDIVPLVRPAVMPAADQAAATVPEQIRAVCQQVDAAGGCALAAAAELFYCAQGNPYAVRAFPVGSIDAATPHHVMVLVEPVAERRQIDFAAVQAQYGLSKRELDVLKLICQGMSNKEIAGRLFISEHTAKDHVKRILQAFNAASRSEVVAALS